MYTDFNHSFTIRTRNVRRIKVKLRLPPHLYSVITQPGKTHVVANKYRCYMFDIINVSVSSATLLEVGLIAILNKRCYSSEIVLFDMFTVILHKSQHTEV